MKYILTVIAAALTLSACSTTAEPKHSAKAGVSDSCCKADGDCSKKH